jgi:D-alanine-D-alanine ligase
MLTNKKIGVLMGGTSAEREVSLRSGNAILNALKKLGYNAAPVDVGADLCAVLKREGIEAAFLALHGGRGEDGSVQGLLEVMGIPYTGSGVSASALAMDKAQAKKVFAYHEIPTPRFATVDTVEEGLALPIDGAVVVKPRTEGSSIGVGIVRDKEGMRDALVKALSFGGQAVIEEFISGREVHIGILGLRALGGVEVRPKSGVYDFESKYTPGLTEYILPPELDEAAYWLSKETALRAHHALGCRGATRVDLMVDASGTPFVLEVNTIPGMTETSLLPKIAGLAGMDFKALIEEILKEALLHFGLSGGRSAR